MTNASPNQSSKYDTAQVGWLFVQEYYTFMNREPHRLHCFYNKKSTFLHGHEGESALPSHGQHDIHDRIMELNLNNCRVLVSNVDTQASIDGGIVIQVLGELSNNGGASHKFAQTFFLAEQTQGFYVLNDIFRFLKEDIDHQYEETIDPVTNTIHAAIDHHKQQQHQKRAPSAPSSPVAPTSPKKDQQRPKTPVLAPVNTEIAQSPASPKKEQRPASPKKEVAPPSPKKEQRPPSPKKEQADPIPSSPKKETVSKPQKQQANTQVDQVTPARPKTWANLAASNVDKFANELSPAKGQVLNTTQQQPTKTPAQQQQQRQNNKNKNEKRHSQDESNNKKKDHPIESESQDVNGDHDFQPVSNRRSKENNNNNGDHASQNNKQTKNEGYEKEKHSVYIKGLAEGTNSKMISDALSKMGVIKSVDILPNRNIAFVEFEKMEEAHHAIGTSFVVNGVTLVAEERRKNNNNLKKNQQQPIQNKNQQPIHNNNKNRQVKKDSNNNKKQE